MKKLTRLANIPETGSTNLGKYTFPKIGAFEIKVEEHFKNDELKKFQSTIPGKQNKICGIPPIGIRAITPKIKE